MTPEIAVESRDVLARELVRRFTISAGERIAASGRFSVVLPGGSVAQAFFPLLAQAEVDWPAVDFFWGDERAVPFDDPDSNYRLAKELWLDGIGAAPQRVHRMPAQAADLDAAAAQHARELEGYFGGGPHFDFVLLGVGPDGHICSLFPGHPALDDKRTCVAVLDSPKPPPRRLTLTLTALAGANTLCIAAFGGEKAAVVAEALHDPASRLPVALASRGVSAPLFLLDAAAARLL